MDAGIADTINRRDVALLVARCDVIDDDLRRGMILPLSLVPWFDSPMAGLFLSEDPKHRPDQAWLFGSLVANIPTVHFDGAPADCDWDNLFNHLRAEILARRDPQTPPVQVAETCLGKVV